MTTFWTLSLLTPGQVTLVTLLKRHPPKAPAASEGPGGWSFLCGAPQLRPF